MSSSWIDRSPPRAPTYVDFRSIEEDSTQDNFFDDVDYESKAEETKFFTPRNTPRKSKKNGPTKDDEGLEGERRILKARRSLALNKEISRVAVEMESVLSLKSPFKEHGMITRQDVLRETRVIELRTRQVSTKPSLKRKLQGTSLMHGKRTKNMTLAESILLFQEDTPQRFHTVPITFKPHFVKEERRAITVPESPQLNTKALEHNKPSCVDKENEKFPQIKANPLNRKIFEPPKFPRFHRGQKSTEVKPFSFEERALKTRLEREKKLQKIREAQSERVPFKARPVPSFILNTSATSSVFSHTSHHHDCSQSTPIKPFKARPPVVLFQEPFIPRLAKVTPVKPVAVNLSTETRAQKRLEFDLQRKAKEAETELARKENERIREEMERRELNELRKKLVHKPVPISKKL